LFIAATLMTFSPLRYARLLHLFQSPMPLRQSLSANAAAAMIICRR